ncbi:CheR family methyltransferase [Candidatus Solincola sp.]|jgi:chemotaxis protein methyltransferase CheR|nr:protein-glutamate O-methyltransferase CheR [Actinomycetota bacterium]MDI7252015.1 protein-glutamate O-methyltransferase CheR [Actinomycetota bacterium]
MNEETAKARGEAQGVTGGEDIGFELLLRYLGSQFGLDFKQYKPNYLRRRIGVRMRATGCVDYLQYRQYVRQHPEEYERLINDLTINVTEFFRDPDVYEALRSSVIPEIINYKRKIGSYYLRAWSAGCATGEEPYSLSILFLEAVGECDPREPWMMRITATDLDDKALKAAREGYYESVRLLPGMDLRRYFHQDGKGYRVKEEVKRPVRFMLLDLVRKPPLRHLDLVLCRNVLIYFEREKQARILDIFRQCLRAGGFLVLGKSETIVGSGGSSFRPYRRKERIYARI